MALDALTIAPDLMSLGLFTLLGSPSTNSTSPSFNTPSKRELKQDIEEFKEDATSLIDLIEVVSYRYKDNPDTEIKRVGFIADDTEQIFSGVDQDKFDVNNTQGVLLKAVQELSDRLTIIESK